MAFGSTSNTNSNLKAFAFKIQIKDLPAPQFEVKERDATGKFNLLDQKGVVTLKGNLINLELQSFDDKDGQAVKSIRATFQDKEEIYFLSIPTNFVGRSIMNALLSLTTFENVGINLYNSKPKEAGGKIYAQASVRQNDTIVRWKYANSDLPQPKVIGELKGKKIIDYSELDNRLLNEVASLGEKIKNTGHSPVTTNPKAVPPAEKHDDSQGDDSVPF